jgi:HPt (histidine-containing phosphotransfer) domain-containing protein
LVPVGRPVELKEAVDSPPSDVGVESADDPAHPFGPAPASQQQSASSSLLETPSTIGGMDRASAEARELVEIFRVEAESLLANIHGAIAAADPVKLRRAAHTLKGAIGTLTTSTPFVIAGRLEAMGRDGDLRGAEASYMELDQLIKQLNLELRTSIGSGPG